MREITVKIYKAEELEGEAFKKAYNDFLNFIREESYFHEGIKTDHTKYEFIEVSNANGWEYTENGFLY